MRSINITLALILGILIMLFFLLKSCGEDKINDLEAEISLLKSTNDSLYTLTNTLGQTVTSQEVIILKSTEALSRYADSIFKLRRKHEKQIAATVAHYESLINVGIPVINIPYLDTPAMRKFSDSVRKTCFEVFRYIDDSTISVPRKVKIDSLGIKGNFTVSKKALTINSLNISDTMYTRVVEIKGGFFKRKAVGSKKIEFYKKKSYEVQTMHTSPLFNTTWQKSYIYSPPKKNLFPKILVPIIGLFLLIKIL